MGDHCPYQLFWTDCENSGGWPQYFLTKLFSEKISKFMIFSPNFPNGQFFGLVMSFNNLVSFSILCSSSQTYAAKAGLSVQYNLIFLRFSFSLISIILFCCPIYAILQSLHFILYIIWFSFFIISFDQYFKIICFWTAKELKFLDCNLDDLWIFCTLFLFC